MLRIVPIKFHHAGRHYDFNAQGFDLKPGSRVVVETDRGRALAIVVTAPREVPEEQAPEGLKVILRPATDDDIAQATSNAAREKDAVRYCKERVQSRNMEMKLVRAEYAFDGSKIVFYFTAEGRIDFRDLVKDLAHHFHTRIEMRQIGVRDEAKLVGGMGICGRELCCCSFLTEFYPVSVKMAKEQGLALNPTKISGQCGRLLCCLGYEFESYCELRKGMPKCGKKVCWDDKEWEVTGQNALGRKITLRQGDGTSRVVTMDEYESGHSSDPEPPAPKTAEPRRQAAEPRRQTAAPAQRSRPAPPREQPAPVPAAAQPAPQAPEATAAEEPVKAASRRKRRRRRRSGRPTAPGEQGE
ncbi:MAG: PSP1 domain-containing protein [Desulfuromonadales bacterium]